MQNLRLYVITAIAVLATPVVAVHSYTQTLLNKPKVISQVILANSSRLFYSSSFSSLAASSVESSFQSSSSLVAIETPSSSSAISKPVEKPKESSKTPEKTLDKVEIPVQILEIKKESIPVVAKVVLSSSVVQSSANSSSSIISKVEPLIEIISSSSAITSLSSIAPKIETPSSAIAVAKTLTFGQQIDSRCELLGCNAVQMKRVMACESGGNASAYNGAGPYVGLFQFLPATFKSYSSAKYANVPNASVYSGEDQVLVATWMFANGYASQWGCK